MRERNPIIEESTSALLAFDQRKKPVMRVHGVKGLWPRVIRSVGETSFGVNRVETILDLNPRE